VQADADQQLPDILMQPDQPRIAAATTPLTTSVALGKPQALSIPISNSGARPLLYHLRVLPDQFAMLRSDEPGAPAYSWIDLPADAPTIKLGDNDVEEEVPLGLEFPFYGYTVTDTLVTSDGTMAFSLPNQQYDGPIGRCFPTSEFHFFVIAPFRADLDPLRSHSGGGSLYPRDPRRSRWKDRWRCPWGGFPLWSNSPSGTKMSTSGRARNWGLNGLL
jgi:hypothetical protein